MEKKFFRRIHKILSSNFHRDLSNIFLVFGFSRHVWMSFADKVSELLVEIG